MSEAVGRHAVALASVAELAAQAGAQRVVLLVDEGATATMVEWADGALAALAGAVVALAAAFGGRSVATAEFATREPDQPFMLAARPGEPVVAQIGGETFAFPEGWP